MQDLTGKHESTKDYLGGFLDIAPGGEGSCLSPHRSCARGTVSKDTNRIFNALPLHDSSTGMQIFASAQHRYFQTVAPGRNT